MTRREPTPVLLYDGLCGFCDGVVQFVLSHDARGDLRFAPLDGEFARGVLARHPSLIGVDSLVLVYPSTTAGGERIAVRSSAAIAVAEYLGGLWRVASISRVLPRGFRDWAYDWFARNRYKWFGKRASCRIPTSDERARFVD